jgi:hypothetical protein
MKGGKYVTVRFAGKRVTRFVSFGEYFIPADEARFGVNRSQTRKLAALTLDPRKVLLEKLRRKNDGDADSAEAEWDFLHCRGGEGE